MKVVGWEVLRCEGSMSFSRLQDFLEDAYIALVGKNSVSFCTKVDESVVDFSVRLVIGKKWFLRMVRFSDVIC